MDRLDDTDERQAQSEENGRRALLLAYGGFIPFAVLALWLAGIAEDHPWRDQTIMLLKSYAAVILSFLGGIRWGLATRDDDEATTPVLMTSVLPSLAGWMALIMPDLYAFAWLAACFAAQGAADQFTVHAGKAPAWFGRLRMRLTVLVTAAMLLALFAVA